MTVFSYSGRNDKGELISGILEAASIDGVAEQLVSGGVTPIDITEKKISAPIDLSKYFQAKITDEELIMFCRQMYSLTRAGVVLNQAMRGLSESINNQRFRKVLSDVETSLNGGMNLAVAFGKHDDVFDDLFINIIQVGENSGRLDLAFQQLGQYLELDKDTHRRIMSAVQYPMFVMIAIGLAIVILNIFVIPIFADLFSSFGAELPWATKVLIATSNAFVNYWPLIFIGVFSAIFGLRYYFNTEPGGLWWDRVKLKIPIIGGILERSMLARFGRSFSLMLRSGVPLIQCLELSSKAVVNKHLGSKIRGMRIGIQRGESLLRTATQSEMFTPLVLQMIQVGEETGKVDELLGEVALYYEQEVDYDLKNLSSYIEPILIVAIAGIVMVLALGIFLPMWDMFNVVQR